MGFNLGMLGGLAGGVAAGLGHGAAINRMQAGTKALEEDADYQKKMRAFREKHSMILTGLITGAFDNKTALGHLNKLFGDHGIGPLTPAAAQSGQQGASSTAQEVDPRGDPEAGQAYASPEPPSALDTPMQPQAGLS